MRVLEIGGGGVPVYCKAVHPDYCNLDARSVPSLVDVVHDLNTPEPLPFADQEWDFIYSRYCLEHISWRLLPHFIKELHRILKQHGGRVYILTSNLREQAAILSREYPTPSNNFWQNDVGMFFGDHDYNENAHAGSMTAELAKAEFEKAGFADVIVYPQWTWHGDMIIEAVKN